MYNDKIVYKVAIWVLWGISLWKKKEALIWPGRSYIFYIKVACDCWGSDQSSCLVGVLNCMFYLTSFLVLHTTTRVSMCKQ